MFEHSVAPEEQTPPSGEASTAASGAAPSDDPSRAPSGLATTASTTVASAAASSGTVESTVSASVDASAPPLPLPPPLLPLLPLLLPLLPPLVPLLLPLPPLLPLLANPASPVASGNSGRVTVVSPRPPHAATTLPAITQAKVKRIQRLESTMRPLEGVGPTGMRSRKERTAPTWPRHNVTQWARVGYPGQTAHPDPAR